MTEACCALCIYFRRAGEDDGECRRNAPRIRFTDRYSGETEAMWPPVRARDWCGEYRPDTLPMPLVTGSPSPPPADTDVVPR